jgi:hypothetical protein
MNKRQRKKRNNGLRRNSEARKAERTYRRAFRKFYDPRLRAAELRGRATACAMIGAISCIYSPGTAEPLARVAKTLKDLADDLDRTASLFDRLRGNPSFPDGSGMKIPLLEPSERIITTRNYAPIAFSPAEIEREDLKELAKKYGPR